MIQIIFCTVHSRLYIVLVLHQNLFSRRNLVQFSEITMLVYLLEIVLALSSVE